jgi:hypothetical protein
MMASTGNMPEALDVAGSKHVPEAKYTPEEIIAKLQAHPKFGAQIKPITKHQSAIISSGLEPAVVIAGAGSGKTETMSNRVLYLVANGFATPDQILGTYLYPQSCWRIISSYPKASASVVAITRIQTHHNT